MSPIANTTIAIRVLEQNTTEQIHREIAALEGLMRHQFEIQHDQYLIWELWTTSPILSCNYCHGLGALYSDFRVPCFLFDRGDRAILVSTK